MLILHYTGMSDSTKACEWLCNAASEVSCHYLVDETGLITQMVDENLRAWHAGLSSWQDENDINSVSIGIEIQNVGHGFGYPDFPQTQMLAVSALCKDICARHAIPAERVLAHSDVAPGRKIDPGEKFDWEFLHAQGVGHYVRPVPLSGGGFLELSDRGAAVTALQELFKHYGYDIDIKGIFDLRTKVIVEAFQRHFRPARIDGIADQSTVTTLKRLVNG